MGYVKQISVYEETDLKYKVRFFYYTHIFFFVAVLVTTLYDLCLYYNIFSVVTGVLAIITLLINVFLVHKGYLRLALFFSILFYYPQVVNMPLYLGPMYYGTILALTSIYFAISYLASHRSIKILNSVAFVIAFAGILYANSLDCPHIYKSEGEKQLVDIIFAIIGVISIIFVRFFQGVTVKNYEAKILKSTQYLNEQTAMLNGVFDSTLDGILVFDKEEKLVAFNKVSEQNFRNFFRKNLQTNSTFRDFIPPSFQEDHQLLVRQALEGMAVAVESKISYKKQDYYFKFVHAPALDKQENIFGSILIIKNVTRRKNQEIQLKNLLQKAQESDRLKSAFIANISHEIRTPMNGILGFSELLLTTDPQAEEKQEYANIINDNCQHLMQIVDDLLDIAKIETGAANLHISSFHLLSFLRQLYFLFSPIAQKKGIEFILSPHHFSDDVYIVSDKKKLRQILTNLLSNAIKFTKEGSVILSCVIEEEEFVFMVKDTGVGIPEEKKELVFERFQQAEIGYERGYDGTGLGLSISKGFTELLGGMLYFESEHKKGTHFYLKLPYKTHLNKSPKTIFEANSSEVSLKGKVILLVDDADFNAKLIQAIVKPMDAHVLRARTGKEAIRITQQHPEIDLILMDSKIPHMNGTNAAQFIQANFSIPIVALVTQGEEMHSTNFDAYLAMPFQREQLIECLEKYLNIAFKS